MHALVRRWFTASVVGAVSATLALTATSQAASPPPAAADPRWRPAAGEPLGPDAVAVARAFVRAHAAEYGLSKADVAQLAVSSVVPTEGNGVTHVYLQQRVGSLEVSTAMLNVAVTSAGEVLRVASSAVGSAGKRANGATPKISDVAAARAAADALGLRVDGLVPQRRRSRGRQPRAGARRRGHLAGPGDRAAGLPGDRERCPAAGVGGGDQPARRPALVADPDGRRHR